MTDTSPDETSAKRLLASARRSLASDGGPDFLGPLAADLFARTPPEDIAVYAPSEVAAFVGSAASLLAQRPKGRHLIRIENPSIAGRGKRHEEITLIATLNDNMPFLLDSTIAEIEAFGAEIKLVAHPIVSVRRDRDGRLVEYRGRTIPANGSDEIRESLIQIHVARLASEEARQALGVRLDSLLVEVRRVVDGWRAIRAKLSSAIAALRSNPPPVDAGDLAESIAFLEWLLADNFTFLGVREYDFVGNGKTGELKRSAKPGLGLLSDPDVHVMSRGGQPVSTTPEIREFLLRPEALIITKANLKSRVHRRTYTDYIGVKLFSETGKLTGELRIVGLFTSTAYSRSTAAIPILRRKVARLLQRGGHDPESHTGRTLVNVLESYPRDELFQIDDEHLFDFANDILALEERPRVRALVRRDKFDRFVSVIVFVPRDRYDSQVRERIGRYLAEIFEGHLSAYYPAFPEAMPLTRVHFIIGRQTGKTPSPPRAELEGSIAALIRTWGDSLRYSLATNEQSHALQPKYEGAFPAAYRDDYPVETAIADIAILETLTSATPLHVAFRGPSDKRPGVGLKLVHLHAPIALSERVPMLENMGFRVIDERSYQVTRANAPPIFVHDMEIEAAGVPAGTIEGRAVDLAACLSAVWYGQADNDGFNALVLSAGLDWRQAAMMRAIGRYLQQANVPFAQSFLWATLCQHADIAGLLGTLFICRFDPARANEADVALTRGEIDKALEGVARLDEDRVIRSFLNVLDAMVRTNFFQAAPEGGPHAEISFKLDSKKVEGLPDPKPFREIFVHSPRVEGVHLRFGPIARGGIRWSDRAHDFRTEVLGLAKAQQVKNAVIVPVGAKGGFVPRRLPREGREAIQAEGVAAYRAFIGSLLDLTDNIDGDALVPPKDVVRHDGDDPYLVVAADKGTSTFSDMANSIAEDHGFWLGDAFASGGSAGYDHKAMGITARGAWEAVKRHFREMDVDVQTTPFTVVGVGDMSGDVFGNGMLRSHAIRLVAAFDHRDIFIDPSPDPEVSFAERQRLFALPRSSWQDYDKAKISAGGAVFSRGEKAIRLSKEARAMLGIAGDRVTPAELMRAILKAKADLLFFGGIGTFVKGAAESDEKVGDRANDAQRIVATEIGAKVVGEGANLAMTQRARVEYGLSGGRCNSDAIDNSAGVNTSDLEVNIKIAFRHAMAEKRVTRAKRDKLLKAMTDEVAALVLANNYDQTLAISVAEQRGMEDFAFQRRFMRALETEGRLDRVVEGLPDEAAVVERQKAARPLTRTEIGVLLAYAKIALTDDLIATDVPDDPALAAELSGYFPPPMQKAYADDIASHRLRREIIVTAIANAMINRGGPTYLTRVGNQTGAEPARIARAFVAVRETFDLDGLVAGINALDGRVPGKTQLQLYHAVQDLLLGETVWFVRNVDFAAGIRAVAERFAPALSAVQRLPETALPERLRKSMALKAAAFRGAGVGDAFALRMARLPILSRAPDILLASEASKRGLSEAATTYFAVAEEFRIGRLTDLAHGLAVTDYYDEVALDRAVETLSVAQRRITIAALKDGGVVEWLGKRQPGAGRVLSEVAAMTESGALSVSAVGVAAGLIADLAAERS